MKTPVRLSPPVPGTNAESSTITAYRLVGYGTVTSTNKQPIQSLHNSGAIERIAGVIQADIEAGATGDVYCREGDEVTIESDGSATIDYGDELIAVAGASIAAGGRVKARGSTSAGTNVRVVGRCVSPTQIPATAGAKLRMRLSLYSFQGA